MNFPQRSDSGNSKIELLRAGVHGGGGGDFAQECRIHADDLGRGKKKWLINETPIN